MVRSTGPVLRPPTSGRTKKETGVVKELVERYKISRGNSLLGVACGTGKHLQHLTGKFDLGRFEVVRVDITRVRGDLSILDEMSLAP